MSSLLAHSQADYDSPTGLLNRHAFSERVRESVARARRSSHGLAVLRIRLDAVGPSEALPGPELLRAVERLRHCLRDGDPLAQLSGCELAVLLHGAAEDRDVGVVARRLLEAVRGAEGPKPLEAAPTVSIGIALHPGSGVDAGELLRNAEAAMFQVKSIGGGFHFYEEGVNRAVANRLRQETSLRQAIERDELMLHYQPQVDVARASYVGVEALLRWRSEGGLAEPASFLPAAESLGLMRRMGEWVLRHACRELGSLETSAGRTLVLGTNASRSQLEDPAFPELVLDVLSTGRRRPQHLEIEVPEDLLAGDAGAVRACLSELRRHGVRVAIDAVGSGRGGLRTLGRVEADALKIDRGLVRAVTTDRGAAAIIAALVTLAHGLECQPAAVGVEREDQARALARMGCTRMQGFAVSPPVAARDLERVLAERLPDLGDPLEEIQF